MGWFSKRRRRKAAAAAYVERAVQDPTAIDRNRLELFTLLDDEKPYETFTQWGLSAWPVKFFVPGGPMDSYGDGFFEEENAHVMTGEELADLDATGRAAAMFGIVARMQLCMTLVTDKRLLWRPLSHTAPPPLDEPGSYATYREAPMGQRWVDLGGIEYVESAFIAGDGDLPDGQPSRLFVRFAFYDAVGSPVHGPPWPHFDLSDISEFEQWAEGQRSVFFQVAQSVELACDFFLLGCARAGIDVRPEGLSDDLDQAAGVLASWRPMHERMANPSR